MNTGQLELRYMVLPHPASKRSLLLSQILSHQAQRNFVDLSHKLLTYIITINKNTNNFYKRVTLPLPADRSDTRSKKSSP